MVITGSMMILKGIPRNSSNEWYTWHQTRSIGGPHRWPTASCYYFLSTTITFHSGTPHRLPPTSVLFSLVYHELFHDGLVFLM